MSYTRVREWDIGTQHFLWRHYGKNSRAIPAQADVQPLGRAGAGLVGDGHLPAELVLLPGGQICFAETKDAGKTPRPRQRRVHGMLRGLGFWVFVPDSKAAVDSMMACIREGGPL